MCTTATRSVFSLAGAMWIAILGLGVDIARAQPDDACVVPDDGTGTAELPPAGCAYLGVQEVYLIIDGLPPGTTIELTPSHQDFVCGPSGCSQPGGDLGGGQQNFDAQVLFEANGTGELAGFHRILALPLAVQTHTGPRTPGDPVQSFDTQVFSMVGLLPPGDPDFDQLQLIAGIANVLPSPGRTTLTRLGPPGSDFDVYSFFDVTYEIIFVGAPGGALDGLAGSTQGTVRIEARGERDPCIALDDGTGTTELPPAGCDYLSPGDAYRIIDGLPPGSEIELDPRHTAFVCPEPTGCGEPGGMLGGEQELFDSTLVLQLSGSGALANYRRNLRVPTTVETHSGPRTPGDPVQSFAAELFSLQGALSNDPDFASLQITAGTGNGLPGPGHTTLTDLGDGNFKVDSFFDITYRIDFVGAPGGALDGLSGSTQNGLRVTTRSGKIDSVEADNGLGTVTLPPEGGEYVSPDEVFTIVDGLPPGDTLELEPSLRLFFCDDVPCEQTGGNLAGETAAFSATLELVLRGTGSLTGLQRSLSLQTTARTDTGPRTPGAPAQRFASEMASLQGSLFGDPDFAELTITAGSENGLPSPGHTTLTDQGDGTFVIDSFFDIDYRIDFVGAPGGFLDGLSGSTTGELRLTAYDRELAPAHSITIVEDAIPDVPTDVAFSGLASFSLDDDSDPTLPNHRTFNNLTPGTHVVTQTLPSGWSLDSLTCVDPDGGSTTDLAAGEATIDLDLTEAITCTFTNLVPEPRMTLLATTALFVLGALRRGRRRVR